MHPTPLRGPKIGAILKVGFTRQFARSISAARVMGNPLARFVRSPFMYKVIRETCEYVALLIFRALA